MKLNEADIIRKIKERAWCKWVSCDVTYSKKFIYPSQSMQSYFDAGISIGNFSKKVSSIFVEKYSSQPQSWRDRKKR